MTGQMQKKAINPKTLPVSPFYSHGMEVTGASRMLFVAGQVGMRPDGTPGDGIEEQAKLAIDALLSVLAEAGMNAANIVKTTLYLTDASLMEGFSKSAAGALASPPAPITLIIVKALASPALLVEIEAIAAA